MLMGLEALGLLAGTRRAGDWSGTLPEITGLSVDSRQTRPGHLFAGLPGSNMHGGEFVPYALRMGAAAILTDTEGLAKAEAELGSIPVPVIVSAEPRRALALAAARWSGRQPETMVAVTGTNGKTSVASFTRQIWEALGLRAVSFGTVGVEGAVAAPLAHTTPEPITLHRLLAELADDGVTHAAMEASSHGLDQCRLDGVRLAAAGFTNISRDHLDYHPDFEAYLAAKRGLFDRVLPRGATAVINLDDPAGATMAEVAREHGQTVLGVGEAEGCDLRLIGQRFDASGQEMVYAWEGRSQRARLDLIGGFQAHNVLMAAGLAIGSGSAPEEVFGTLEGLRTVPGRMERAAVRTNGAAVFVDYAHTPEALATALAALRPHVLGRLLVVFGAGGDRDRGKRPLMGRIAAELSDVVLVTSDNPRTEDAEAILDDILEGAREVDAGLSRHVVEVDRAAAIAAAIESAGRGDMVVIAGKGHEPYQLVGDRRLDFDDRDCARSALRRRGGV